LVIGIKVRVGDGSSVGVLDGVAVADGLGVGLALAVSVGVGVPVIVAVGETVSLGGIKTPPPASLSAA